MLFLELYILCKPGSELINPDGGGSSRCAAERLACVAGFTLIDSDGRDIAGSSSESDDERHRVTRGRIAGNQDVELP